MDDVLVLAVSGHLRDVRLLADVRLIVLAARLNLELQLDRRIAFTKEIGMAFNGFVQLRDCMGAKRIRER